MPSSSTAFPDQELIKLPPKIGQCKTVREFLDPDTADIEPPSQEERERKPVNLIGRILSKDKDDEDDAKDLKVGDGSSFFKSCTSSKDRVMVNEAHITHAYILFSIHTCMLIGLDTQTLFSILFLARWHARSYAVRPVPGCG